VTVFEWQSGKQPMRVEAVEMDLGASDDEDFATSKDADTGEVSGICFSSFLYLPLDSKRKGHYRYSLCTGSSTSLMYRTQQ